MKLLLVGQAPELIEHLKSQWPDLRVDSAPTTREATDLYFGSSYRLILFHFKPEDTFLQRLIDRLGSEDTLWAATIDDGVNVSLKETLGVEMTRLFVHPPEPGKVSRQIARLLGLATTQAVQKSSEVQETFLRVNRARVATLIMAFQNGTVADNQVELLSEAHRLSGTLGTFGYPQGTEDARAVEDFLRSSQTIEETDSEEMLNRLYSLRELLQGSDSRRLDASKSGVPTVYCFSRDDRMCLEMTAKAAEFRFSLRTPSFQNLASLSEEQNVDLVILNLETSPSSVSSEIAQRLKELVCPVVAVCSDPSFRKRIELVEMGVELILQPPISGKELLELAASFIQAPAGTRILALDDDPLVLSYLESVLTPLGASFSSISHPRDLWTELQSKSPDVLLLDYDLPTVDGLQLCRALRADPMFRELAIIFSSATATAEVLTEAWRAGATDFVPKTLESRAFTLRLLSVIRRVRELGGSSKDSLTGLKNRSAASKSIKNFLGLGSRRGLPVSLAVIDLDHFKSVNDRFGHPVGDSVLRAVATILKNTLRTDDVVSRWGGEEFVAAMFLSDKTQAKERLEEALKKVRAATHTTENGESFHVSFSAGVAQFPIDGSDLMTLYERADQALYTAKSRGRSQVVTAADRKPLNAPVDVVLIEDDHPLGMAIVDELQSHGLHCVWFQSAREAQESMLCEAPYLKSRVLVVDKALGLTDGLSLVREFKEDPRHRETRIITCSATMSNTEIEAAYGLGVMEHISKPFAMPVLVRQVKRAVSDSK